MLPTRRPGLHNTVCTYTQSIRSNSMLRACHRMGKCVGVALGGNLNSRHGPSHRRDASKGRAFACPRLLSLSHLMAKTVNTLYGVNLSFLSRPHRCKMSRGMCGPCAFSILVPSLPSSCNMEATAFRADEIFFSAKRRAGFSALSSRAFPRCSASVQETSTPCPHPMALAGCMAVVCCSRGRALQQPCMRITLSVCSCDMECRLEVAAVEVVGSGGAPGIGRSAERDDLEASMPRIPDFSLGHPTLSSSMRPGSHSIRR